MKVLYITTAYPRSEKDIITPWLVETVQLLQGKAIDITVFTSAYQGLGDQTVMGTRVKRFRYFFARWEKLTHDETAIDRVQKGFLNKILAFCYLLLGTMAVWRLCRKEHFDIIHVHWPLPHFLFGYVAGRVCAAPIVISFHGAELMAVRKKFRLLRPFLRWAIARADRVTANSTHTVRAIQEIFNRSVDIVPFGAAVSTKGGQVRVEMAAEKSILFVGRLVERKGVRYLIEAAAQIASRYNIRVDIVGDGPELPKLMRLTAEKGLGAVVRFHGRVSAEELPRFYENCDIFVLPAVIDSKGDTEGLGVVLIEAMTYKKPVIASAVGGITDLVIDGQTGLAVPPGDGDALVRAIVQLIEKPELAQRLSQQGYEHILANYSWGVIIDRLITLYQEVYSSHSE